MDPIKYDMNWRMEPAEDGRIAQIYYNNIWSDFLSFAYRRRAVAKKVRNPRAPEPEGFTSQKSAAPQVNPPWKSANYKVTMMGTYLDAETFFTGDIDSLILDFAPTGEIQPLPSGPKVRAAYLLKTEGFSRMHHLSGESITQVKVLLRALALNNGVTMGGDSERTDEESMQNSGEDNGTFDTYYHSASNEREYGLEHYSYTGLAREVVYEWPDGFAITVAGHGSIMVVTFNGTPLDNLMLPVSWHHDNYREMIPEITRLYKRGTFISTPFMSGVAIDFTDNYVEVVNPQHDRDKRFRAAYVSKNPNARHLYATYASSFPELVRKLADFSW